MTWEKDTFKFDSNACVSASKQKLIKATDWIVFNMFQTKTQLFAAFSSRPGTKR